ncbi:MAG: hypothetical protein HZRFUVUK_001197 [Candidatus Fervidibacterota bacterium]|jgi:predicted DNA-binding antitoxin AbrB/MazE fold protein
MPIVIRAIYDQGAFKPIEDLNFTEGKEVQLIIWDAEPFQWATLKTSEGIATLTWNAEEGQWRVIWSTIEQVKLTDEVKRDNGHSAADHKLIDRYDGEIEIVLVEQRISDGRSDLTIHVMPKRFTTVGVQWTHFLEWLGFRYFHNCPHVSGRRCLWRKWESSVRSAREIAHALEEAYRHVNEADRLLRDTPLKLPESNSGWLYFFVPQDMERYDELMRLLAEL